GRKSPTLPSEWTAAWAASASLPGHSATDDSGDSARTPVPGIDTNRNASSARRRIITFSPRRVGRRAYRLSHGEEKRARMAKRTVWDPCGVRPTPARYAPALAARRASAAATIAL